jgi:hypothetical protein
MAENKKSFILYCDIIHTVNLLNDSDAGKLFKHILEYVNDKNPITDDMTIKIAFEPIKQQLKRDLIRYENLCERNAKNGKNGGRPKKPKKPNGINGKSEKPKKADNDNDNDNDNGIEIRKEKFNKKLNEYLQEYGKQMLYDFFMYWTEHGDNDKKMRYEKEKTFGIKARLNTWKNRSNGKYDNPNQKFKSMWS